MGRIFFGTFRGLAYSLYLVLVISIAFVAIEYAAMQYNKRNGITLPFLWAAPEVDKDASVGIFLGMDIFSVLDPHLGYAHSSIADTKKSLAIPYSRIPGFVIYGDPRPRREWIRPVIVTLGGSTTDPMQYGQSWPEELWKIMNQENIEGTVVNGGVGGYSSSQELLKLIRDAVELHPDVVISYNGVNDTRDWQIFPTPMVNRYQRDVFEALVKLRPAPFLPNSAYLFNTAVMPSGIEGVNFGIPTDSGPGEFLVRNIDMMEAVSKSAGILYLSFLQPLATYGSAAERHMRNVEEHRKALKSYVEETYEVAVPAARERNYMIDLTHIFEREDTVYKRDGVHLEIKGNQIIARKILSEMLERKALFQP